MEPVKRRVVFVVGAPRSGTSAMAGALRHLGMHVPLPDVAPDATHPHLASEPQWVVDLHTELFTRTGVQPAEARPQAWYDAGKLAQFELLRQRTTAWLEQQFGEETPELVVKDPRLSWFAGLWRAAALRCGATPSYVVMLRPVPEVVGGEQRSGAVGDTSVQDAAAWLNLMLHTERATRGSARVFVRYPDLLEDWTIPVFGIGRAFDLAALTDATANQQRAVHAFVDPGLRHARPTWDDLDLPDALREIAQQAEQALDALAEPGGDLPEVHDRLDRIRADYAALYAGAEALSASTASAAYASGVAAATLGEVPGTAPATAAGPVGSPGSTVERVPHRVRALVPASARRGLRRALGRQR